MLEIDDEIRIPLGELCFEFTTSSGPGGQHVNRSRTRAVLRWNVARSPSLPEDVRQRFLARYRRRINASGELLLASQRTRDQGRNVADCVERLRAMLREVAPAPKRRRATKPSRSARRRRLEAKRRRSDVKAGRRRPRDPDA